ncbi:MAG: acyl carrier protein [Candidatus Eremiobacteraeota bacterium]|nr:acyl carrier protein [Candidatus Eremiobacteraeota bacterium]MBC5803952.1 acyl carrier protein [Candidatus Eremiobacteraeota bacterium]MBC5824944.1 acyl carrier protein [Candidatus Eremiobacteraeota bacterium]
MGLKDRLRALFADVFETDRGMIDESMTTKNTAEWDSLRSIVLATTIESEFGIEFSDQELVTLDSFQKIYQSLIGKGLA